MKRLPFEAAFFSFARLLPAMPAAKRPFCTFFEQLKAVFCINIYQQMVYEAKSVQNRNSKDL